MNTVRQGVYVGVLLAALAAVVALMMAALANRPAPYELSSTEVAGLPVLGASSSPACGTADSEGGLACTSPSSISDNADLERSVSLLQRAKPVLRVPADTASDEAATERSNSDAPADHIEDEDDQVVKPQPSTTTRQTTTGVPTTQPPSTTESTEPATARAGDDDDADDSEPQAKNQDDEQDRVGSTRQDSVANLGAGAGQSAQQNAGRSNANNSGASMSRNADAGSADQSATNSAVSGFEAEVVELTNELRADNSCGPLQPNNSLHGAARAHSNDMAKNDYFDHAGQDGSSPGDRAVRSGYSSVFVAENIAWGYRTPEAVVQGWLGSSGHRGNMLDCEYVHIGVGFHDYYWTQVFGLGD